MWYLRFESDIQVSAVQDITDLEDMGYIEVLTYIEGEYWKLVDGTPIKMTEVEKDAHIASLFPTKFNMQLERKLNEIDQLSQSIIYAGTKFDSHIFSLSRQAQTNWSNLMGLVTNSDPTMSGLITFPYNVTALDISNGESVQYSFADKATYLIFYQGAMGIVAWSVATGRALKIACQTKTTLEELNAIIDDIAVRNALSPKPPTVNM